MMQVLLFFAYYLQKLRAFSIFALVLIELRVEKNIF